MYGCTARIFKDLRQKGKLSSSKEWPQMLLIIARESVNSLCLAIGQTLPETVFCNIMYKKATFICYSVISLMCWYYNSTLFSVCTTLLRTNIFPHSCCMSQGWRGPIRSKDLYVGGRGGGVLKGTIQRKLR